MNVHRGVCTICQEEALVMSSGPNAGECIECDASENETNKRGKKKQGGKKSKSRYEDD